MKRQKITKIKIYNGIDIYLMLHSTVILKIKCDMIRLILVATILSYLIMNITRQELLFYSCFY